jgi:hypothetical protein
LAGEDVLADLQRGEGGVRHGDFGEGDEGADGVLAGGEGEGFGVEAGALVWECQCQRETGREVGVK